MAATKTRPKASAGGGKATAAKPGQAARSGPKPQAHAGGDGGGEGGGEGASRLATLGDVRKIFREMWSRRERTNAAGGGKGKSGAAAEPRVG